MSKKQSTEKKAKRPAVWAKAKPVAKAEEPTAPAKGARHAQVAPQPRDVAPSAAESAKPKGKSAPAAKGRTLAQDPRLPARGTVLQKTDRHGAVRCECKVEEDGIRYAGTLYRSISTAALAAAKDLGLKNKTQNGYIFWGLAKPATPTKDPIEALEKAWSRYRERAEGIAKGELADDVRKKIVGAMVKHAMTVEKMVGALK